MSAPDQNDDDPDEATDLGAPSRIGETPSERLRGDVRDLKTRVVSLEAGAKRLEAADEDLQERFVDYVAEHRKDFDAFARERRESNEGIKGRIWNHETATGTRFSALELQLAVNTRLTQEVVTWSRWTIGLLIGLVGLGFTVLWNVLHK